MDQRRRYKEVFNQDYDEYKKLHSVVDQVSQKFSALESELQRANPGSGDYKVRFQRIMVTQVLFFPCHLYR